MPVSNVSAFVGRADDLAAVDDLLMQNSRVNIAAAVGMGGVGKTELALQYALRCGDAFPGGVCWLRGVEPIVPQVISFAQDFLNLKVPEQTERPVAWCCQRWPNEGARQGLVLMVVDNVQDYGALKLLLPSDGRFRVLLTTRQAILPRGQRLALEVLVPEAALDLLKNLVGEARIEAALEDAKALCEWVGRLPLGIELVGYFLEQRPGLTLRALLARLEGKRLAAKALMQTHPEMTATLGVAAAFEVSWEPLSVGAKMLAGLLGLFAAAPIDWAWVQQACEQMGESELDEEDLEDLEEAQAELLRVSLLQAKGPQNELRYQVHPLVREFFAVKVEDLAEAEGLQRGFAQGMTDIAKTIPQAVTLAMQVRLAEVVPHFDEVVLHWTSILGEHDKTYCCDGLGRFYKSIGQWGNAERCYQRAVDISRIELGEYHLSTALSINNLAELYGSQGRYAEAELLHQQALKIAKIEPVSRYLSIALSLNNLAALYSAQGRYAEAEPLYQQALKIRKAELGEQHLSTANSLNNLAELFRSQGRYVEAEPLYQQALKIVNRGNNHPYTAHILNNLAELYRSQSQYVEAELLHREALKIRKTELGDQHLDTAQSLDNLALLYDSQGRYRESEPLHVEALEIRKTKLGDRHPATATSLNNLAGLYRTQGHYGEAEPLYVQALEIRKAELGDRHPATATSLNNLALLYKSQGRYEEAEPLFVQALEISKAELGDRHPSTATSLFNLAALYHQTQRHQQALSYIQQALDIYQSTLGSEHPNTQLAQGWLVAIQQAVNEST